MTSAGAPLRRVAAGEPKTAFRAVGEGPLLLLIHAAEADHSMFFDLMDLLARDFRVVAYDQRDSGETVNAPQSYGLADLADDAAVLIDELCTDDAAGRACVFGTSFGGQIAQALAARYPARVSGLVLASTWRVGRPVTDFNAEAIRRLAGLRAGLPGTADEIASYFFTESHRQAHPEVLDWFRSPGRTEAQRQRRAEVLARPHGIELSRIVAPTLLLAGSADRLIPASATFELAMHLSDATSEEVAGMAHAGVLEKPAEVAKVIRRFAGA